MDNEVEERAPVTQKQDDNAPPPVTEEDEAPGTQEAAQEEKRMHKNKNLKQRRWMRLHDSLCRMREQIRQLQFNRGGSPVGYSLWRP